MPHKLNCKISIQWLSSILFISFFFAGFFWTAVVYADTRHACALQGGHIDGKPCSVSKETELKQVTLPSGYYCCMPGISGIPGISPHLPTDKCSKYYNNETYTTKPYEIEQHIDGQECNIWHEKLVFQIAPGYNCCRITKCSDMYNGDEISASALKGESCDSYCKKEPYKKKITVQSQPDICCCKRETYPLKEPDFYLQIPIGKLTTITKEEFKSGKSIPTYISALYRWGVGFTLILGVIALMLGGIVWLIAGGSEKRVSQAKGIIKNSLVGIFLALGSYLFLWIISPQLVQFRDIRLTPVKKIKVYTPPPPRIEIENDACGDKCWDEAVKRDLTLLEIIRDECKKGEEKTDGDITEVCVENKCKCRLRKPSSILIMPPHPEEMVQE